MKTALTFLFSLFLLWATAQRGLVLVKNGKSTYHIIIAANADSITKRAASIFHDYIKKISGAELPVLADASKTQREEVLIGKTNRISPAAWTAMTSGLGNDGFLLQTLQHRLTIAGVTSRGSVNGVVGFLEDQLGCRKYAPDAEYIPVLQTIVLPALHDLQVPPAGIRIINGAFPANAEYKDWRKLATVADLWNDGDWKGYYVHTFRRLVPPDKYFAAHPEYFSLVNGKRISYGQLCLTNPEVYTIAVNQLRADMALHPEVRYWSVSQNDTYDNCQCDACRKLDSLDGSPAGSLLNFVNRVAAAFPDKVITTLAYQYTRKPPLHTRPASNVMVTLCTIELNRSRPIETDPGSAAFKQDIIGWSNICRLIMLWDYEVQFTNYLCPFPLFHTLQPNIQFFTKYGVTAHFQQCNAVHGVEFAELKTYLLSKLLWNPNANADSIINDFMKGYYGHAAPFIRKYFDLLHEQANASKQGLDIYGTPVWHAATFLSADAIKDYYKIFDDAEAAVKDQPALLERVKIDRLCVQYADMEIGKTDLFGERGWYRIIGDKYMLRPERKLLLDSFYAVCKRNNVVQFNENGLTADSYYAATLRFINVEVEGNLAFKKPVTCDPLPAEKYSGLGPQLLTNGVKGTEDYKINWLGWEGKDLTITVDLEKVQPVHEVILSSLQYPKSWILHPLKVVCSTSVDGKTFMDAGVVGIDGDGQNEPMFRNYSFKLGVSTTRFIRLKVTATSVLPAWHTYVGNHSWVFLDEVLVK